MRRALTARDRDCRFPGCGMPATWCTAHHIRPWERRGTTRLPNLVLGFTVTSPVPAQPASRSP